MTALLPSDDEVRAAATALADISNGGRPLQPWMIDTRINEAHAALIAVWNCRPAPVGGAEVRKLLLWAADSFDAHANAADHPEEVDAYRQCAKMYRDVLDRMANATATTAPSREDVARDACRAFVEAFSRSLDDDFGFWSSAVANEVRAKLYSPWAKANAEIVCNPHVAYGWGAWPNQEPRP